MLVLRLTINSQHWLAAVAVVLLYPSMLTAQQTQTGDAAQQHSVPAGDGNIPVIRSTTTLVFLDVTVLDKKGHPVVKGLTKDDFTVTEDKKTERIFSFEEPDAHDGKSRNGELPKTILVLDQLNTSFQDFAYLRDHVRQFLLDQPDNLRSETELIVAGTQATELLQGFTRSRADLLFALDHLPRAWPYRLDPGWASERVRQSYIALQQIAVQNRGMPGRKNVLWIGNGISDSGFNPADPINDRIQQYVHRTVNMMVEARISLFLILPRLQSGTMPTVQRPSHSVPTVGGADPFAQSNFSELAYKTGGEVFGSNDVDREMGDSVQLGSKYYTLTYQPPDDKLDGGFRRIQVKLRNPELHVMTKAGFFSRDKKEAAESDDKTLNMLTEAALAVIPMKALHVNLTKVVRHPDAHTVEITAQLDDHKLGWQSVNGGLSETTVIVTAVGTSAHADILASRVAKYALVARSQDASKLADVKPEITFTLRVPSGTKNIRVAIATNDGSRIGSADLTRKEIDALPAAPALDPRLLASPNQTKAATH